MPNLRSCNSQYDRLQSENDIPIPESCGNHYEHDVTSISCNTEQARPMAKPINNAIKKVKDKISFRNDSQSNIPNLKKCDTGTSNNTSNGTVISDDTLPILRLINASHVQSEEEESIYSQISNETLEDCSTSDLPQIATDGANIVYIKTYKRRFYILIVYCLLMWFTCMQWGAWGPISESVIAAFPDWSSSTVAMMENWVTCMFVICVLPVSWFTSKHGLRLGMILSSLFFAIGLSLRCITDKIPLFTITCHLCSIAVGISVTLLISAPPMIASVWFPQNERTCIIAVIMAVSQLGTLGSYLEPLCVKEPADNVPVSVIRSEIMTLNYVVAGAGAILFLIILAYFPSCPPHPPSITSSTQRLGFKEGLYSSARNKPFLVLVLCYGVAVGPSLGWIGILNISLQPLGFSQDDAMFVGMIATCSCFAMAILAGRWTDLFYGHLKETAICLLLAASLAYYWFLLISLRVVPVVRWQVYVSVSLGLSLNYASISLFYEMAVELAFRVPEVLIGGIITASDCLFTTVFLFMYFITSSDFVWVGYVLVASSACPVIGLLFINIDYTRYQIDSRKRFSSRFGSVST